MCVASREGAGADHHSLSFRSHGGRNNMEDNKGRGGRHCLCCGVLPQKGEVSMGLRVWSVGIGSGVISLCKAYG